MAQARPLKYFHFNFTLSLNNTDAPLPSPVTAVDGSNMPTANRRFVAVDEEYNFNPSTSNPSETIHTPPNMFQYVLLIFILPRSTHA